MLSNFSFFLVYLPFLFAALCDAWNVKIKYEQKNVLLWFLLFIMVVFAGFRWSLREADMNFGDIFDYSTYKKVFEFPVFNWSDYLAAPVDTQTMEIGYVIYSSICNLFFNGSYQIFLVFTSFLTVLVFYKGLLKNQIRYGLFFLFFFYFSRLYFQYNFILMRQALAMLFCWYAFSYLIKKEWWKYWFAILLAVSFHTSALICIFCPLILKIRIKEIYFIFFFFLFLILSLTGGINAIIIETVSLGVSVLHLPEIISGKLLSYTLGSIQKMNLVNFIECIPFYYMFRRMRGKLLEDREGKFYYNMFYVFLLLMALTMNFSFLMRLIQYFMYSYFFILSFYIKECENSRTKKIILSMLVVYGCVYFVRYYFLWFNNNLYEPFFLHL